MFKYVLVLEKLHVVVPNPLRDTDMSEDFSVNTKGLKSFKRRSNYLEQIRRDVKVEVLPVLLLQIHSLVEEHVGAVRLRTIHISSLGSPPSVWVVLTLIK